MTESASQKEEGEVRLLAPVREGDTVAGKYLIERTLGFGGMGVVFAARDTSLDREVAIKFLLPRLASAETAVQRFLREARAATRVTSEHVVKLLEIDNLPSGTPFIVMEYLEGRDLRAVLREEGPLEVTLAVDYLLQALQAVAEGHTKKIVHRDLKPSNLFVTNRADGTPLIKVLDFGIAKTLELDPSDAWALTRSEDVRLGSPAYMPPEQLQNPRDVDTRSDIWSLGVTLYELVSGKPPFQGGTYVELISRILSQPPESLKSESQPRLPDGLAEVIGKCLEKDRNDRYPDAADLAGALAPFGTDDSRLSLHRVTGLLRAPLTPRPATPVPSAPVTVAHPGPLPPCDTTLPVAVEPAQAKSNKSSRRRSEVSMQGESNAGRGKWIVLALGVSAIAIVIWRTQSKPEPAPSAEHQSALVTSVSSLRAATTPPAPQSAIPAEKPASEAPTPAEPSAARPANSAPHADSPSPPSHEHEANATAAKPKPLPPLNEPSTTRVLRAVSSATVATASMLSAPPPPPPPTSDSKIADEPKGVAESNAAGPSDAIEKLIEKRH